MRRFRDGSITEAVPWTREKTIDRKRIVCSHVVRDVLSRFVYQYEIALTAELIYYKVIVKYMIALTLFFHLSLAEL